MKSSASGNGHGQFKVVAKLDSALLPEAGHKSGWVNKQQDRADAAVKGRDWRSEAFKIV